MTHNQKIYYDVYTNESSKENLVFVHGSGCNRKFLRPLAKKLSDFNCYLPDLPDHGKSVFTNCQSVEEYIDSIAEFVSDLENVTLIGHSLGGTICIGVAAKAIPSVKKCIIISSGATFDKLDQRIHTMVEKNKVDWFYLFDCLGSLYRPSVLLDCLNFESPEIILKDFDIDIKLDLADKPEHIKVPTLIMVSKNDILTIPEYSAKLKKKIKNAKLVYFFKGKHMLPIVKRKQVAKLIREFINNN